MLIRDAFVSGVRSTKIRQRLLESDNDELDSLVKTALTMDLADEDARNLGKVSIYLPPTPCSTSKARVLLVWRTDTA